jgi:hypothetical protein
MDTFFKEFCQEFTSEVNHLRMEGSATIEAARAELPRIEKQVHGIIEAIKDGMYQASMKTEIESLEARKKHVTDVLASAEEPPRLLHPNMAEIYRQRIASLHESLRDDSTKAEAAEIFRNMVDEVTLVPERGVLAIMLRGDLAAMLSFAAAKKKPGSPGEAGLSDALLS